MRITFTTQEDMIRAGFEGFQTTTELRATRCSSVPKLRGVYVVVRDSVEPPCFLDTSPGGHFKGRDPTLSAAILQQNWVVGTPVVYIGQAGGGTSKRTLRKRVGEYVRFGAGSAVGHWGGRCIWQLADHGDLRVGWRPSADGVDPLDEEASLLSAFRAAFGVRPFANLRD